MHRNTGFAIRVAHYAVSYEIELNLFQSDKEARQRKVKSVLFFAVVEKKVLLCNQQIE